MFERLTDRFQETFRSLRGKARLTEANVSDAMRDIRKALLDADVNYHVAKDFVAEVRKECLGERVLKSITPGQQAIKIVHDHLVTLLGESNVPLALSGDPAVIMLVGLHGSGKTTTAAKLALHLRKREERRVMLAAGDLRRPAAIDQLEILGSDLEMPVYSDREASALAQLAVDARNHARNEGCDTLILDTAGRLEVDEVLIKELVETKRRSQPCEILLVADAALGQEAVSVAEHFDQALGITGIILTKLDGDARGGAALSMRQITGKPVKFVGVGENSIDLDAFFPDRMASRILGMGDVVSLVERASEQFEEEEARELEEKLRKNTFNFEDFVNQLNKIRRMGGMMSMLRLLPGMGSLPDEIDVDEQQFNRIEGIINGMTPMERQRPEIIGTSRRQRIARGSGVSLLEVNQLIKQFSQMRRLMSRLGKMGGGMFGGGGPGGMDPLMGGSMPGMGSPMGPVGGFRMGGGSATKAKKTPRKKRDKPAARKRARKKKRR